MSGELPIYATAGFGVRFVESDAGALTVLEILSSGDADLFGQVSRALYAVGVDVERLEMRSEGTGLVGRLHLSNRAGTQLDDERRLVIQDRVLQVVLAQPHKTCPPEADAKTGSG
jgi:hypothetical protein